MLCLFYFIFVEKILCLFKEILIELISTSFLILERKYQIMIVVKTNYYLYNSP